MGGAMKDAARMAKADDAGSGMGANLAIRGDAKSGLIKTSPAWSPGAAWIKRRYSLLNKGGCFGARSTCVRKAKGGLMVDEKGFLIQELGDLPENRCRLPGNFQKPNFIQHNSLNVAGNFRKVKLLA
jgi:hypothetical protein